MLAGHEIVLVSRHYENVFKDLVFYLLDSEITDRIADLIELEELEELRAESYQHKRLEEDLREREQAVQGREEVLLQRQRRDPDLERRMNCLPVVKTYLVQVSLKILKRLLQEKLR